MIMRIPILKSILRNLDWFEEAQKHHKAPEGTIFVGGINHRLKKEDWAEQKHPRADDGKFTSGSGGGSKKPSKTKRKLERRAEAASQGRVSGAIQTLLSGGSALDKIGWLNTSKPKEPEKKPESKPQQPEKKPEPEKPKPIDMSDVPKNKSLITGSVSVSYDTKIRNRNARFVGGEDSPSGEHVHNEDAGYIIVPNTENFIYVQTHSGKSGWYPDIYNNTRRTNYYPGSKEDALTDIAAHPGGPKADELYPTLADAIASNRSIPKNHNISAHTNKPPKTFDGAAVLEEYYRAHPEKRPPEVTPQQPEKPKAKKPAYQGPIEHHPDFDRAIRSYAEEMAGTPEDENIDDETLESLTPRIYRQHGKERLYLSGTKHGGYITRDKEDVKGNPEYVGEHGGWYYKLETKETRRATNNIKTLIDHMNEKNVK